MNEDTAWRAMKTWRSLWQVAASMRLCVGDHDPSFGVRRASLPKRNLVWTDGEVVQLVKAAIRLRQYGLACIIAVAYDTQLSPGDVRTMTAGNRREVDGRTAFSLSRSKTGRAALGTISRRTQRLVTAYWDGLGVEWTAEAPLFRAMDGQPYKFKDRLSKAFARVRNKVFPADPRTLQDMRTTGSYEATAGGGTVGDMAAKMANNIDRAGDLQATYIPVDAVSVGRHDEARKVGRSRLRALKKTG